MSAIPTILVSGPLGSGKTSLLRHLIGQKTDLRFAAVVNDFGEIGIDGDLLRESTSRVIEVTGGCICCCCARRDQVHSPINACSNTRLTTS